MTPETYPLILQRIIVVPIIRNSNDQVLICRKPPDRGVFPGQWGLPGGGVEPGERIIHALVREVAEELGIEIGDIRPLNFKDGIEIKHHPDGHTLRVHMIYLLFECQALGEEIHLNEEFVEYAWVQPADLHNYDLNGETIKTFIDLGILQSKPN
jgi:nucleoside triphosphatase